MFSLKPSRKKNEIMKFLGFSKIGEENFKNIFRLKNFFFFLEKYIFEIFSPDFGTKQKLHVFVFFLLGIERKSFPEEKISFLKEEFSRSKLKSREIFLLSDFFPDLIFHLLIFFFFLQIFLIPVIKIIKS